MVFDLRDSTYPAIVGKVRSIFEANREAPSEMALRVASPEEAVLVRNLAALSGFDAVSAESYGSRILIVREAAGEAETMLP